MTDQPTQRHPRRTTAIIVGVLVLVVAAVVAIGLLTAGRAAPAATTGGPSGTGTQPVASSSPSTSVPLSTATPKVVVPTASSSPQPTRTATISKPTAVPIKKELSATVVTVEAVSGKADGPGEIGGPSVRFTIRITNTTGKTFSLANTVVNAFYGKASSPAVPLRQPGGKDFPTSVANGASATGVFVFNIPKASRSQVEVTVDTAVQNPVIAFKGSAPRG